MLAALAIVTVVVFAARLGQSPLQGTEGLRAIPAHQMSEGGSWAIPRLWGEPYLAKPPLHYWILAGAERLTGHANEWVWRLPSAVSMGLLVLLVGWFTRASFGRHAGVIAAGAVLALVALWSEGLKADIDATNTLAVTAAVFCLFRLDHTTDRRGWLVLAAGLAIGAMLLLKGPAGAPVVAGMLVAPAIVDRRLARLRRPAPWIALLIGGLIAASWVIATAGSETAVADVEANTGAQELLRRLTSINGVVLRDAALLPIVLLAFALPVSIAVPAALRPEFAADLGATGSRRVRLLLVTVAVAIVISMLARTTNPRYVYVALPPLAVVAGVVGAAWTRGVFSPVWREICGYGVAIFVVAATVVHVVMLVILHVRYDAFSLLMLPGAVVTVTFGALAVRWLHRQRRNAGLIALLVVLLVTVDPFAALKGAAREAESSRDAAAVLRTTVGDSPVLSDAWVMTNPDLFHYAGVDVHYRPGGLLNIRRLDDGQWVVFHEEEWERWQRRRGDRFEDVVHLPVPGRAPVLARYRDRVRSSATDTE